jgi:capsular polysaccharide biosynthesis protein
MNVQILCVKNGIPIVYNNGERNIETIFALGNNRFTFDCPIYPDTIMYENAIQMASREDLENGYLFYSFRYQISYAHFMCQTVPKLKDYLESYSHMNLLVPEHHYNNLHKELFELCGITRVVLLKDNTIYNVKHFVESKRYPCVPSPWTEDQIWMYKYIRQALGIPKSQTRQKRIYIQRDSYSSESFGNSEIGKTRQIQNESELLDCLKRHGFEIVTLGTKYLREKMELLSNAEIIVCPIGATCINFAFINAPKHILFLSNDRPIGDNWYKPLCEVLNNCSIHSQLLCYPSDDANGDPTNRWNSPYRVSISEVETYICNI